MNGPDHYSAAERLLDLASRLHDEPRPKNPADVGAIGNVIATPAKVATSAEGERLHMARLARLVRAGFPADVVGDLLEVAMYLDPMFGKAMEPCDRHDCTLLVDDDARDADGHLWCSDACRDADSEDAEARRYAAATHTLADDGAKVWTRGERADIRLANTIRLGAY